MNVLSTFGRKAEYGRKEGISQPSLSVIIPVLHADSQLMEVIEGCLFLSPLEIIVVSSYHSLTEIPDSIQSNVNVKLIKHPPGIYSGRVAGATVASGEILLFLDADYVLDRATLQRFLFPVLYSNAHAVLRKESCRLKAESTYSSRLSGWRFLMNQLAGRPELDNATLYDAPHVLTRRAIQQITISRLGNPADAHQRLCHSNLLIVTQTVERVAAIPYSPLLHGAIQTELSVYEQVCMGDYLGVMEQYPPRNMYSDGGRRRDILKQILSGNREIEVTSVGKPMVNQTEWYSSNRLSVIIPACNEERTIGGVIREVRKLKPTEIIVVVNGSTDQTAQIATSAKTTVVEFNKLLGTDTGRAIGAALATGDILLFLDADFILPVYDLYPFALAGASGIDVALGDSHQHPFPWTNGNPVAAAKEALNQAMNRKDLRVGSLVTVPFALSRKALSRIGWSSLVCPPKALVACALEGLTIQLVHRVEVARLNRFRPEKHIGLMKRMAPAVEQIVGDHVEALQYLIKEKGARGGFRHGNE